MTLAANAPQSSPTGSRHGSRQHSPIRKKDATLAASAAAPSVPPLPLQRSIPLVSQPSLSNLSTSSSTSGGPASPNSVHEVRFTADTPRSKKRVLFNEHLCEHAEAASQSRSHTPTPMHQSRALTRGATSSAVARSPSNSRPKGVLKKPATHHVSANMSHVVRQVLSSAPSPLSSPGSFAQQAPLTSPAALLQLQVALFHDTVHLDAYCTTLTRMGSILIKYNSSGKPMKRWFYVQETAEEIKLCWSAPKTSKSKPLWQVNPNGLSFEPNEPEQLDANGKPMLNKAKHKSASSSLFPSFTIGKWKFNQDRSRSLLEVSGVHYGPYYSANFCRFLDKQDSATGKPWLCFSVQFKDRTIDLVCSNEHEVTAWFLGLQAQAPQTCFHMTRGMILWQRMIMKLNYYGLDQVTARHPDSHASLSARDRFLIVPAAWCLFLTLQIKRVFAKRAAMAQATSPNPSHTPMSSPPIGPMSLAQRQSLYGDQHQ
jgi:hypothetical protein